MTEEKFKIEEVFDATAETDRGLIDLVRGLVMTVANDDLGVPCCAPIDTKIGMFQITVTYRPIDPMWALKAMLQTENDHRDGGFLRSAWVKIRNRLPIVAKR